MHNFDTTMRLVAIRQDELLRTAARERVARSTRSARTRRGRRRDRIEGARS
jgi:hypothetical protein